MACLSSRACRAATCGQAPVSDSSPRSSRASPACSPSANVAWLRPKRRRRRMPPDFNPNFQEPHWSWLIVLYFFLGGLTGGIYFAAAWLDLFGERVDRSTMRLGHLVALPLIII